MVGILAQIQFSLPSLVPITMQTLGIYLIGLLLKPRLAFISALLYISMGAVGLPVYSGFSGGLAIILGPTGGYLFSFPIMALVISLIIKTHHPKFFKLIALITGTLICYLIGTLWFMYTMEQTLLPTLTMCVLPFLPGDVIKIMLANILSNKLAGKLKTQETKK